MAESAERIDASRTALLVMDYQHGILGRLPEADAVVANAARAIETVRRAGGHVGYVRVAFTDADLQAVLDRNKGFSAIKSSGMDFGTEAHATQIDERLALHPGDIVVRKTRVGAFSTTDLAAQLKARDIDTLILAGISTSGVVLSTVRDGADRDYRLYVLSDACADAQPDVHACLMEKVLPRQADVITTDDLGRLLAADGLPNRLKAF